MREGLADLKVLITAAGSGIGWATATAFEAAGARVHICDNSPEALEAAREARPAISGSLTDVAVPAEVDRLFDEALAALGGLDVLVNNAGIAGPTGPVEAIEPDDWRRTIAVNLDAAYLCARCAAPVLKGQGHGSLVNISSTAGLYGYPQRSPYAAAKWAVIGLTKSLAGEFGPHGVRANAVCPGAVEGPRMDRVIAAEAEATGQEAAAVRDGYTRQSAMGSFIEPGEIADTVLFLSSPAAAKINGEAISVDGYLQVLSG